MDWTYANFKEIAEAMRGEKEYAQTVSAIYGSVQRIEENTEELRVIKNIMRDMQSRGMQLRSS